MQFSIVSLLGLFSLSILSNTCVAAGAPKRSLPTNITNTEAIVEIIQLISYYGLILDDNNYSDLSYVLTEDVVLILPTYNVTTLPVVEDSFYRPRYLNKITLHASINAFVYDISTTRARVTREAVVSYLGQGNFTGQIVTFYSRVNDALVKENGSWKIAESALGSQVSS